MDSFQKHIDTILKLESISATERELLLSTSKKIEKEVVKKNFMLLRTEKDKEITTNVLNATIEDLEKHKTQLEIANNLLLDQKQIIEGNLHKLELSYKELEQFSYIASHDLKSPLRTISSFAQLLKRRYFNKLDQDANEFIEFIVSGVQQMNDVIRNSLEYAKVGKDGSIHEWTDLNKVLDFVCLNLKEEINSNTAKIIITNSLPSVFANKTSLLQLFQNLISNAIKFRQQTPPIITISFVEKEENLWEFSITDNGIGIDEIYQKKVFMPFKQLHGQGQVGEGIGLAICKKIVEHHNGSIYFTSQKNKGTTFVFTLPK